MISGRAWTNWRGSLPSGSRRLSKITLHERLAVAAITGAASGTGLAAGPSANLSAAMKSLANSGMPTRIEIVVFKILETGCYASGR